jgi:hypothetical protein
LGYVDEAGGGLVGVLLVSGWACLGDLDRRMCEAYADADGCEEGKGCAAVLVEEPETADVDDISENTELE